jgi:hypothetical protein
VKKNEKNMVVQEKEAIIGSFFRKLKWKNFFQHKKWPKGTKSTLISFLFVFFGSRKSGHVALLSLFIFPLKLFKSLENIIWFSK